MVYLAPRRARHLLYTITLGLQPRHLGGLLTITNVVVHYLINELTTRYLVLRITNYLLVEYPGYTETRDYILQKQLIPAPQHLLPSAAS